MPAKPSKMEKAALKKPTAYRLWPAVAAVLAVTGLTLLCSLPGEVGFIATPFCFVILYPLVTLTLLVWAVGFAVKRRWGPVLSVVSALLAPIVLWGPIIWTTERLHLGLSVAFEKPYDAGPNVTAYDWSVGFAGGPLTLLIHDPTDKAASPSNRPPPSKMVTTTGEECAGRSRRLLGHYYICQI